MKIIVGLSGSKSSSLQDSVGLHVSPSPLLLRPSDYLAVQFSFQLWLLLHTHRSLCLIEGTLEWSHTGSVRVCFSKVTDRLMSLSVD